MGTLTNAAGITHSANLTAIERHVKEVALSSRRAGTRHYKAGLLYGAIATASPPAVLSAEAL